MSELICLETNYKYSFSIVDSFEDGICCAEREGSHVLKVDNVAILEVWDFGETGNYQFKFQNCVDDEDCDDDDYRTTHIFTSEAATCLHIPKACHESGYIAYLNITTFNFPESATWLIKDDKGVVQYEGGPYELSKRTFSFDLCLLDSIYTLRNTGSDLIGRRLVADNDGLLIDKEYLQSGETDTIIIGQPKSCMRSTSPSIKPSNIPFTLPSIKVSENPSP